MNENIEKTARELLSIKALSFDFSKFNHFYFAVMKHGKR